MRRYGLLLVLVLASFPLVAQNLRGPVAAELSVTPVSPAAEADIGIEEIALLRVEGDSRFYDAVEIEITAPGELSSVPGALVLVISTVGTLTERAGVADINGNRIVSQPLTRTGKSFFQVPMRTGVASSASAAVLILDDPVPYEEFPLAVTVIPLMKGLPQSIARARIEVAVRPVTRAIGAAVMKYTMEDGSEYQGDSLLAPEFELSVDGGPVDVSEEYLLTPGLHRVSLRSDKYIDQEVTFGVERGLRTTVEVPLLPALAKVSYTAPRGASVYVDGQALGTSSGDFTAPPGEHTIVVVMGDYTVTRRFSVVEGRSYSVSVTMDVVVEEAK